MDTRAKRFRDNYEHFASFVEAVSYNVEAMASLYKLMMDDPELIKQLNSYKQFAVGNLGEAAKSMELSNFLDRAAEKVGVVGSIFATDIDKIVRVDDEIKAIFEIKHSTNGKDVLIKYNHYKTLKLISQKLGVPVYFVVKHAGWWYIKPLRDIYEFSKNGDYWNCRLKLAEMLKMDRMRFVEVLADILR